MDTPLNIQKLLDKRMAITTALTLIDWDEQTLAPEGGMELTSNAIKILNEELYSCMVNDEIRQFINENKTDETAIIRKIRKDYKDNVGIPKDEFSGFRTLTSKANRIWAKAKEEDNFDLYKETLTQIIEYVRKFARYRQKEEKTLYDVLLNDYEPGFDVARLDVFFDMIKSEIVPVVKKHRNDKSVNSFNYKKYDIEKQKQFCEYLATYLGFDFKRGVMAESAHPFTTNLHNKDVRITNHYYECDLEDAIFSCIHEVGHGLYELNIPDNLTQTIVGTGATMGMHESQSRFYENIIGRSKAFWKPLYGKLQDTFADNLKDVELEQFIIGINEVKPGLIRTQADELTYPIHIMIRYEVEKMAINDGADVDELKKAWDQMYEEYTGIRPERDSESILQDVHWSGGDFGYFPSYALGNAFGAQIFNTMKKDLKVDELLESGKISVINDYLKEKIHKYGATLESNEILLNVTGEEFNPKYYIDYLKEKFM